MPVKTNRRRTLACLLAACLALVCAPARPTRRARELYQKLLGVL